jgi:hypothetical protein
MKAEIRCAVPGKTFSRIPQYSDQQSVLIKNTELKADG